MTEAEIIALYASFDDSVIRSVTWVASASDRADHVVLIIDAQRQDADGGNWVWKRLTVIFEDLREMRLPKDGFRGFQVLSGGMDFIRADGLVLVDFLPWDRKTDDAQEYRKSDFYIACKAFRIEREESL